MLIRGRLSVPSPRAAPELVANSVRHSGSAVPGGLVTMIGAAAEDVVRVEVTDRSGDGIPALGPPPAARRRGAGGMRLVDALASRWGYERGGGHAMTWFEVRDG